jgi:hypothetical protein
MPQQKPAQESTPTHNGTDALAATPPPLPPMFTGTVTLVTPEAPTSSNTHRHEPWITLVKAIAWPVVALIVLWTFHDPAIKMVNQLADAIFYSASTRFGLGSFTFEMQQEAVSQGIPAVGFVIGHLSPPAVEVLLQSGGNPVGLVGEDQHRDACTLPSTNRLNSISELEKQGLVTLTPLPLQEFQTLLNGLPLKKLSPLGKPSADSWTEYAPCSSLSADHAKELRDEMYRPTEMGKRAFGLIVASVASQLRGAPQGSLSETPKPK